MAAGVEKEAGESKEVWFSGLVGADDFLSLGEMATAKAEILFPGVIAGWSSKEDATSYLATLGSEAPNAKKVIYHATTTLYSGAKNLFGHRYSAKIESLTDTDNINVIELSEVEAPLKAKLSASYAEWKDKVGPALEALKAVAPVVEAAAETPAEEPKAEGEEPAAAEEPPAE